ncbi:MAG: hypothetical protein [Caudoviricetes sp.]|nr:MAG: hypothetical protein [Caudoviricetes sp.]
MLDEKGFKKNSYEDILSGLIKSAQERFGADIATNQNSVMGGILRLVASTYNEIEQKQEDSYYSSFVSTATGVSLDRLAKNFGLDRKLDTYAIVDLAFVGKPGYVVKANTSYKNGDGLMFTLSSDVKLDNQGSGTGIAYANETGKKYNISSNNNLKQVQPVGDLYSIVTKSNATGGTDAETDTELRNRIMYATKGLNSSTYGGVVSSIRAVPGVTMVRIVENHSDQADQYGNPPYTIHIYASGGDDSLIGSAIFKSLAIGINTYGKISLSVEDEAHNKHTVMFDRPTEKQIHVKVTATTNDSFPVDGVNKIKQQISDYMTTLEMGKAVRFSYMYKYIYDNVAGIEFANVLIGVDQDNDNLQSKDVIVNPFELPVYNPDLVNVEVVNG